MKNSFILLQTILMRFTHFHVFPEKIFQLSPTLLTILQSLL